MRRIDYLLNAKDPIKVLVEEFDLELDCFGCLYCDTCHGHHCDDAFVEYLEQNIEVNESDLKTVEIKEKANTKETLQETLDEVKESVENEFMEEYKKIVTATMELCAKKNKDYGSSV